MCGINGMVLLKNVKRSKNMLKALRYLFTETLVNTQERGHHATGIVSFQRDGVYRLHKAPQSANLMTTWDTDYDAIIDAINDNTSLVLSHTRWYTKGKPENNENNHPFDIGNVIGVHNGTVANDDDLFKKNEGNFKRVAEVDSEIIYQLINHHNRDGITFDGLKLALESSMLKGMFALAFAHKNQPNLMHIVKQERPLDFVLWEEAGVVLFNSEKKFIDDAFNSLFRANKFAMGVSVPRTLKTYELKKDNYLTIDANAESLDSTFSEPKSIFLSSSAVKTNYSSYSGASSFGRGSSTTHVSASDSVGKIIEGELDIHSGEVIIFTSTQIANAVDDVGGNDDGSEMDYTTQIFCIECESELQEHEVDASWNEEAHDTESYYCTTCYQKALSGVFRE